MKHAITVLAGLAVGLPVMAALASVSGHTTGGLPDRYVPWTRAGHRIHPEPAAPRAPQRSRPRRLPARRTVEAAASPPAPPAPPRSPESALPSRRAALPPGPRPAPVADLRLSIEAPPAARPGDRYSYLVTLANRGPATPGAITVRSILPKGTVRVGASLPEGADGDAHGREAVLVVRRLDPGRSAAMRLDVEVGPKARGTLVARSMIAHVAGVRDRRPRDNAVAIATRVVPPSPAPAR